MEVDSKLYRVEGEGTSLEQVKEFYERRYASSGSIEEPSRMVRFFNQLTLIPKVISKVGKPKALDIGCGARASTEALRLLGCRAYGIDLSEVVISKQKKAYPLCTFWAGDVFKLPERGFDIIYSRALSIYNSPFQEGGALSEAKIWATKQILKLGNPGGLLVLNFYTIAKDKPFWNEGKTSFYHTVEEVEPLFSLFGQPLIRLYGKELLVQIYMNCETK